MGFLKKSGPAGGGPAAAAGAGAAPLAEINTIILFYTWKYQCTHTGDTSTLSGLTSQENNTSTCSHTTGTNSRGCQSQGGLGNLYDFIADNFNNPNLFSDDDTLLPVHRKHVIVAFSLVDCEHKHAMMEHTWIFSSTGYVQTTERVLLHRWLLDFPEGLVVDHINWDRLDNTTENLRAVTQRENTLNAPNGWLFGKRDISTCHSAHS